MIGRCINLFKSTLHESGSTESLIFTLLEPFSHPMMRETTIVIRPTVPGCISFNPSIRLSVCLKKGSVGL